MSSYEIMVGGASIIILSYFYNHISKKFKVPSVILLILTGFLIATFAGVGESWFSKKLMSDALPVIGKIGLILIVLEAALDLKLKKEDRPLMMKAFWAALIILVSTVVLSAGIISLFTDLTEYQALVYAIPLSIMSSAIIIPSVGSLTHSSKEFMIYESTFSDILGVMLFQSIVSIHGAEGAADIAGSVFKDLGATLISTVVLGYAMIFVFQKLHKSIGLFFLMSILILLYGLGSMLHLSSLLMIFFFGLIINNTDVFFKGKLKGYIKEEAFSDMYAKFKLVVEESAFLVRTLFFVLFGMSIQLGELGHWQVWIITGLLVMVLYVVRFFHLKWITKGQHIKPELYIAPRGLITILLIDAIPRGLQNIDFKSGITLLLILSTCVIMMVTLIKYKKPSEGSDHNEDLGDEGLLLPEEHGEAEGQPISE